MTYRITNVSPGPRGVWAKGSLVWLEPGEAKVLMPDDLGSVRGSSSFEIEVAGDLPDPSSEQLQAVRDPLDHDGDGRKGGSVKRATPTRRKPAAKRKAAAKKP